MMVPEGPGKLTGITPDLQGQKPSVNPEQGKFAEILNELRSLKAENSGEQASLNPEAIDPTELGRQVDQAEKTFRKAMEIHRDLADYWQQSRSPYNK